MDGDRSNRRCVRVIGGAESGDWRVSVSLGENTRYTQQSKVAFVPRQQPEDRRTITEMLRVEMTYLDDPRQTYTYVARGNVFGLGPQDEPTRAFFVTSVLPPRTGQWMLVATSGPKWGCFILDAAVFA